MTVVIPEIYECDDVIGKDKGNLKEINYASIIMVTKIELEKTSLISLNFAEITRFIIC